MKTLTSGLSTPLQAVMSLAPSVQESLYMWAACMHYIGVRWNGREVDIVLPRGFSDIEWTRRDLQEAIRSLGYGPLPLDGAVTIRGDMLAATGLLGYQYTEGPGDKAFMEAQDRRYLREIASTHPRSFLLELTPHDMLRDEDIAKGMEEAGVPIRMLKRVREYLGLDLRLPHHQNLQREFAALVEHIRDPGKEKRAQAAREKAAADARTAELVRRATEETAARMRAEFERERARDTRPPAAPSPLPSSVRRSAAGGGGSGSGEGRGGSASREALSTSLREIPASEMAHAMRTARKLGAGGFGEVHLATLRDGMQYAVKSIRIGTEDEATRSDFYHEARVMARLNHPLMVHLYAYCSSDPEKFYLVMEYMALGSLFKLLHSKEELSWSTRLSLFLNVAQALAVLHDHGIVHRDLKSENILLKMEDGVRHSKIGDFGLAKAKAVGSKARGYQVGTAGWTAPEIFLDEPATEKSDVYSLGVVLWEMLTRLYPLDGKPPAIIGHLVMGGRIEDRKKVPRDAPESLVTMMLACLMIEADARPTAKEVLTRLTPTASTRAYSAAAGTDRYSVRNNPESC